MVIFTVNLTENGGSTIVALNKQTGTVAWQHAHCSTYLSPVAVYNKAGDAWIIQGDESGKLTMLKGLSGQVVTELALEVPLISPAVYNDYLVVGTTGRNSPYLWGAYPIAPRVRMSKRYLVALIRARLSRCRVYAVRRASGVSIA